MSLDASSRLLTILTLIATVGTGVAAGVFFAFSTFVMAALRRLPDSDGIRAMNAINTQAPTAWFMTALLGTAALCGVLGGWAVLHLGGQRATYVLVGAVLYLAQILLTVTYHVPRNNALLLVDPDAPASAARWRQYARDWTRWNHGRTALCVAACAVFAIGLRVG
ncbi:MAG: anthrone oxygenase family protein [Nocardioidaceae bacterium]